MEMFTYLVVASLIFNVLLIIAVILQEWHKSTLQNQIDSLIRTVNKMSPAYHSYRRKKNIQKLVDRIRSRQFE